MEGDVPSQTSPPGGGELHRPVVGEVNDADLRPRRLREPPARRRGRRPGGRALPLSPGGAGLAKASGGRCRDLDPRASDPRASDPRASVQALDSKPGTGGQRPLRSRVATGTAVPGQTFGNTRTRGRSLRRNAHGNISIFPPSAFSRGINRGLIAQQLGNYMYMCIYMYIYMYMYMYM